MPVYHQDVEGERTQTPRKKGHPRSLLSAHQEKQGQHACEVLWDLQRQDQVHEAHIGRHHGQHYGGTCIRDFEHLRSEGVYSQENHADAQEQEVCSERPKLPERYKSGFEDWRFAKERV